LFICWQDKRQCPSYFYIEKKENNCFINHKSSNFHHWLMITQLHLTQKLHDITLGRSLTICYYKLLRREFPISIIYSIWTISYPQRNNIFLIIIFFHIFNKNVMLLVMGPIFIRICTVYRYDQNAAHSFVFLLVVSLVWYNFLCS
jgi:hypothetical protein